MDFCHRAGSEPSLNQFFQFFLDRTYPQAWEKGSAEFLKNKPVPAWAFDLFYASLTFRPGTSSPSLGSFHLEVEQA